MPQDAATRLQGLLDREELFDLVRRERFARDQRRFDVMRDCFHPDAYVRTSWYDGRGGEAYVEATREFMGRVGNGKHWVFPAFAQIAGDRATVESPAMIFSRTRLDNVEVDFHVFCRFFSRAVRVEGVWKLMSFEVLFERDVMKPVNPSERLPVDWSRLETLRPSYKFLAWIQQSRGVVVNPDLLGDDRPVELAAFHAGEDRWLAGAD
nr:nuclear transport factor 2 family protein [Mesorhizobium sp.]